VSPRESIVPPASLAQATIEMAGVVHSRARAVAEARILRDGAVAFPAMIELIDAARSCVRFENFIFAGDATGEMFAAALTRAAKRGVDVRVLYDPIGTMMVKGGSVARMLTRDSGVAVQPFRPFSFAQPWSWIRLRHRDHRKTLAVDGEIAVVGGLCISDNWSPSSGGGKGWRDTGILVRGPVAADLEAAFDAMWRRADEHRGLPGVESAEDSPPPAALIAADEPGKRYVSALYQWLAERARRTLEITDAYLVAPRQILMAFESAARRGVEVRLLLPGRNNHPLAGAAARHIYAPLLDAGAGIWEWDGVMLHAKTAVVDGEVTMIGSSNLDPLSMRRNYELNLVVADEVTGAAMREMFAADLREATRIDAEAWRRRPAWQRTLETAAGLFGPNL
jgi:cardiolipin synthase